MSTNIQWQSFKLTEADRAKIKHQKPLCLWMTGLHQKARAGDLKDFTGIDSPYEAPEAPEIEINTENLTVEQAVEIIVKAIL